MKLGVAILMTALCAGPGFLFAQDHLVLCQGISIAGHDSYQGSRDAMLVQGANAARNYGGTASLWVGRGDNGDPSVRRSLICFDLTGLIPPQRKVAGAILILHCVQAKEEGQHWQVYVVAPKNADWIEGANAKGIAEAGVCSWNNRINFDHPWEGGPGLGDPGNGYSQEPVFESSASLRASQTIEIKLPAQVVEAWRKGENGGLLFRMDDETQTDAFVRFAGNQNEHENLRPTLKIELAR